MQFQENVIVGTNLKFFPTHVVGVAEWSNSFTRSQSWRDNADSNLKKERKSLELSAQSRRKLSKSISWLIAGAKTKYCYEKSHKKQVPFKINCITLTIPFVVDKPVAVKDAGKMLNAWLTYARKYNIVANYIWKLEFTKQGQAHYHITSDRYVCHKTLRRSWNLQLRRFGFLDDYFNEHGHYNANSTDVHAAININNLAAYLAKYLMKAASEANIACGRLWGCCQRLSRLCNNTFFAPCGDNIEYDSNLWSRDVQNKAIYTKDVFGNDKHKVADIFLPPKQGWLGVLKGALFDYYSNLLYFCRTGNSTLFAPHADKLQPLSPVVERCNTPAYFGTRKPQVRELRYSKQINLCL